MKKVIVIGSGVSGIAVSIRLALKGYDVQVFEQNSYPGGKLSSFSLKGYRFDAGPSLFRIL
jgi:phytoene dehydrogenase-like protein